uniref:Uncharacterized protein n=1 Tax=Psilocybe cubensis TaxID=181762 RepID=A0A8H8CF17_PSICU
MHFRLLNQFAKPEAVAGNTRTMDFYAANTKVDITLLLMFEPPAAGKLYSDLFPTAWKVITFSGTGINSATVTYTAATGFFAPQLHQTLSLVRHTGQRCTLAPNSNGQMNHITDAKTGTAGVMQCTNVTPQPANIGIGFFNKAGNKMEPAILWQNVAKNATLSVQLTPRLKIYATTDYKTSQLITGDVESPLLFYQNLIGLAAHTEWNVIVDEGTGEIKIVPVSS